MRRIPIKRGYINTPANDIILFYSGLYRVIDKDYHLLFIANKESVIYDTLLLPAESVKFVDNLLIIESNEDEVFIRIGS